MPDPARARLDTWRRDQVRAGNRIGVAEEIAWLCDQLDARPVVDVADLTHRIAVVLMDRDLITLDGPCLASAAEAVVEMMLTAGDLPRATPRE